MVIVVMTMISLFGEAVHVELTYVGVHVFVFEEHWKYVIGKFLRIGNYKSVLGLVPVYNVAVLAILTFIELTSSI